VGGLAAAGLEQLGYFIGGEGAAEHLSAELKTLAQGAQLQGHRIAWRRSQPALEPIDRTGLGVLSQTSQGLGRLASLIRVEGSISYPGRLGETG
jgi:hypothetical protein